MHEWATQSWELVKEEFLLYAKLIILHITAVDFEVDCMCLQWTLQSCVGGGSLGIYGRLGLISPLRAPKGSVGGSSRRHTWELLAGSACSWRSAWSKLCSDLPLCSLNTAAVGNTVWGCWSWASQGASPVRACGLRLTESSWSAFRLELSLEAVSPCFT